MNDHDEIETERLVLRPLAPGHVGALHDIYSDRAAMRFWHEPPHRHAEQTRAMVERFIAGSEHAWVLCRKPQEDAVGLVYYLGNTNGHAGMGYILAPCCWGQGLMTERAAPWRTGSRTSASIASNCGSMRATSPHRAWPRARASSGEACSARSSPTKPNRTRRWSTACASTSGSRARRCETR